MFDLSLSPLYLSGGRELADLPGLIFAASPRRAARRRAGDMLVALLSLTAAGNGAILPAAQDALVSAYFSASGTVTAALRAAVEKLNDLLLSHAPVQATINLAVVHEGLLYLAQAGPANTLVIGRGPVSYFSEPVTSPRLGATRTAAIHFHQAALEPGDIFLLTADLPSGWPAEVFSGPPDLELLRRRLIALSDGSLRAALLQAQPGSGHIYRVPSRSSNTPAPSQPVKPETRPVPAPSPLPDASTPISLVIPAPASTPLPLSEPSAAPVPPESRPLSPPATPAPRSRPTPPASNAAAELSPTGQAGRVERRVLTPQPRANQPNLITRLAAALRRPPAETILESPVLEPLETEPPAPKPRRADRPWMRRVAGVLRGARSTQATMERGMGDFLPRLLPGAAGQPYSISPATMFFIAVAIPVVMVAIATTVYMRSGASQQRIAFVQQARVYADQASAAQDAELRHSAWTQSMYWVKKAEEFGQDDETRALRHRAQTALDSIDGISRLTLTPAFSGLLSADLNITRIIATDAELYLLDSTHGRVLRLTQVGADYELDASFNCGPGPSGGGRVVGALVSAVAIPVNNEKNASLVAIDKTGNLLYCIPGEAPLSAALSPPENNWGEITAMTINNGDLYVLDPANDGVQRYDGVNYGFGDLPRLFFGNQVPDLSKTIDMANYADDLYLLNKDGTIILCTYSDFASSPTRCQDPAPFGDARTGQQMDVIPDTRFLSLVSTDPPDPSLYILDASGPAVYHFSLRLNLQRQYRQDPASDFPLPQKSVTAFTVASNRTVFLAFGNQVFYGVLP